MDDIVYEIRGVEYNLADLLKNWNSGYIAKDITDILRYVAPDHIVWQQKKNNTKVEFNIFPDEIRFPEECPITGTRFDGEINWGTLYAPSLDRINPKLGYVQGNVTVIRFDWNTFKSNSGWTTLRESIKNPIPYIQKNYKSFKVNLRNFGIKTIYDWYDQLTNNDNLSLSEGLIRLLINAEYTLWLHNKVSKTVCLTILEYEPELFDD